MLLSIIKLGNENFLYLDFLFVLGNTYFFNNKKNWSKIY